MSGPVLSGNAALIVEGCRLVNYMELLMQRLCQVANNLFTGLLAVERTRFVHCREALRTDGGRN
ncbi:hypothetical protein PSCICO_30720 [Pseudomonas cichorii]|nr:hypothetical protein PSCICO_30720 [Pseudomonas cichorii]